MWTPEFNDFVAPARARPQVWRLVLGTILIGAAFVLAFIIVVIGLSVMMGPEEGTAYLSRIETGGTPTLVVLLLAMFAGPLLAAVLVVRHLHKRPAATLFGAGLRVGFLTAVAAAVGVYLVASLLLPAPFELVPNLPPSVFFSFLPLAIVALLIQTGAEEVVFRGYMQQQLAARFHSPWVWMVFPSVCFGILHVDPSGGWDKAWVVLPPTLFVLIAADLTRVTGSIGLAWGLHFANNASAILFTALSGSLSGLALYRTPFGPEALSLSNPLVWQEMTITVIIWALIRLWLARRAPDAA